ncbi:hypothetical protein [Gordonia effusa]|uniref:hypothetical protein n=1 Tax=Gordonia effusa TaxID=263908 RepID=UPI00110F7B5C|nr:hypothetical protein [Gordonia effusa]
MSPDSAGGTDLLPAPHTSGDVLAGVDVDAEFAALMARTAERARHYEQLNEATDQRGNVWSLPAPEWVRQLPMWTSRAEWQQQLRSLLNSELGAQIAAKYHVSVEYVFATGVQMASFADHETGRHVTVGLTALQRRTGLTESQVYRSRLALADLGCAREVARGRWLTTDERDAAENWHGRKQARATSHWVLIPPRPSAQRRRSPSPRKRQSFRVRMRSQRKPTTYPQSRSRCGLPRRGQSLAFRVLYYLDSPTHAYTRARSNSHRPGIAALRSAGQLLTAIPALAISYQPPLAHPTASTTSNPDKRRRHTGELGDVIARSGLAGVDGRKIARAIEAEGIRRGWCWPDTISNPPAFLAERLRMLPQSDLLTLTNSREENL